MGSIAVALDSRYAGAGPRPFMRGCINRWERFVRGWHERRCERNGSGADSSFAPVAAVPKDLVPRIFGWARFNLGARDIKRLFIVYIAG